MVYHWNLDKSPPKRCLTSLVTSLSTAVEEDQGPEVTNIIDMQDNLHQYQGMINKQAGQIHMLPLTKIDLIVTLVTITGIDAIHIPHLITCITQLIILITIIIIIICHIAQMTCTP